MEKAYVTMKELGKLVDATSHQIGKKLKELGLRTAEGRPSQTAFEENWVAQKWAPDGAHYLWAWDKEKTLSKLKSVGIGQQCDEDENNPG